MTAFLAFLSTAADFALKLNLKAAIAAAASSSCWCSRAAPISFGRTKPN
jgi:hypothetical protein